MKILITGGAGFIGSNLAAHFVRSDWISEVRILDDLSAGRLSNLAGLDVDFVKGTILDFDTVVRMAQGVDSIVHLAAIGSVPRSVAYPRPTHDANITGTLNVLEAARTAGVDHIVAASSSSVYGSNENLPKSEFDWTRPMSPYGVSKLATEAYTLAYNFSYGVRTLAFRFFNVYGPHQPADHVYAAVIPKFLDAALSGTPLTVNGDGLQSRDFTFVDSVCSAIGEAVYGKVSSTDPVNLAFGTNTTILDLISKMEEVMGREVAVHHAEPRVGDIKASQSDGVRMRELFPNVQPTPLAEGIEKTLAWFRRANSSYQRA